MTTLTRVCRFLPPIVDDEYPADLLAARRAEFVERIREGQRDSDGLWQEPEQSETINELDGE